MKTAAAEDALQRPFLDADMEKIVVACDSFKGSLSSAQANAACAEGLRRRYAGAEVLCVPIADGGEGTGEALAAAYDARKVTISVPGPLGEKVDAPFYVSADRRTAIIDTASASGLTLVKGPLDPMRASSYGTGKQIEAALAMGCRNIVLGLGGSATVDCGTGLLQALGYRFLDSHGMPLGRGASILPQIVSIDSTHRLEGIDKVNFTLYSDVDNPLCGPDGAAYTFGPQKGCTPAQCEALDSAMECFATVVRGQGYDDTSCSSGAGAAGGIGFALTSIIRGDMRMGAAAVLETIDFENIILDASLVVTGEGRLDLTTLHGKAPFEVLQQARRLGIPCEAIGGSVAPEAVEPLLQSGFSSVLQAKPADMPLAEAMKPQVAARLLALALFRV